MKVLVCGDRKWTDEITIYNRLAGLKGEVGKFTVIVGDAKGADSLGWGCAMMLNLPGVMHKAQWLLYGRAAGPIRNRKMLDEKPDLVLAFHNDIARSRGTKDCVEEARRRGIPVEVIGEAP